MTPPLAGLKVLVTRPAHQAAGLTDPLAALGSEVLQLPATTIAPPEDPTALDAALRDLASYDWVAFTSANGVDAVHGRMMSLGLDPRTMGARRLAAVGPATAAATAAAFRTPDLVPNAAFLSEGLADALGDVAGLRILLPRADLARKVLGERLREAGARVDEVDAYRILPVMEGELPEGPPDIVLFASSSAVRATYERLAAAGRESWLGQARIGCLGPIVAATVEELGLVVGFVAEESTIDGLVRALVRDVAERTGVAQEFSFA